MRWWLEQLGLVGLVAEGEMDKNAEIARSSPNLTPPCCLEEGNEVCVFV